MLPWDWNYFFDRSAHLGRVGPRRPQPNDRPRTTHEAANLCERGANNQAICSGSMQRTRAQIWKSCQRSGLRSKTAKGNPIRLQDIPRQLQPGPKAARTALRSSRTAWWPSASSIVPSLTGWGWGWGTTGWLAAWLAGRPYLSFFLLLQGFGLDVCFQKYYTEFGPKWAS